MVRAPVTVVMITRDRAAEAGAAVERLRALPERPPIIVVDNGSGDGAVDALRSRFPGVTVIPLGRNLGAAGRNVGVRVASTPYVAFADDDSWWEPGALARAAAVLDAHPSLALLAAAVRVGPARELDPTCLAMRDSPLPRRYDQPGPSVLGFIACGAVVRRDAFLAAAGFDALLGVGGEEQPLALAANGWDLCHVDEVVAIHQPSPARDPARRDRVVARNDLWTSWLRRPWRAAIGDTVAVARDPARRGAFTDALRRLPTVLRHRRAIPTSLDAQLQLLRR